MTTLILSKYHQSFCFLNVNVAVLVVVFVILISVETSSSQLTPDFYDRVCPDALPVIRKIVQQAIQQEPRMGASLLRLHFHDCFVNV